MVSGAIGDTVNHLVSISGRDISAEATSSLFGVGV